jgi:hypothetical protein
MKSEFFNPALFIFLIIFSHAVLSQEPEKKGFLRSTITLEELKKAKTVEELIVNMPPDYEVVFFRLSIAGKNIKTDWTPDFQKNILNNTFQYMESGQKVYIEYIEVKRKGSDSKAVRLQPRELIVID